MTTQMEAAKEGTLTEAMQVVARSERMHPQRLRERAAAAKAR